MTEINQLVDLELKRQLKALPGLETGSAEQTAAVKNLTVLYEARINEDKLLLDAKEKQEARESELRLKEADREEKKVDRMFHAGIALLEIGLPLVCYGHWFRKGLKFEETGSITSSMMRNLINKFRTKK